MHSHTASQPHTDAHTDTHTDIHTNPQRAGATADGAARRADRGTTASGGSKQPTAITNWAAMRSR